MTDWSGQDFVDGLRGQGAARAPASIGEIWNAQFAAAGLDTIGGVGRPYREADDELVKAIEGASGKGIADYARDQGVLLGSALTPVDRQRALSSLVDTLPEDARKTIAPLLDLRKRAAEKARKIEDDAADVTAASYGLSGTATSFAAGMARQMIDPANVVAMVATGPLGGAIEGNILKVALRQAAAGAVSQALVEPYIEPKRAELGLDAGIGRAAENIIGAGVGGAVIGGSLAGVFRLAARAAGQKPRAPVRELDLSGDRPFTGYLDHADAETFFRDIPIEDRPPVSLGEVAGDYRGGGRYDFGDAAKAQPTNERLPDQPHVQSDYAPDFVTPETVGALDRGHTIEDTRSAIGSLDVTLNGGRFDIPEGARARRTNVKLPDQPHVRSDYAPGYIDGETLAALDRGHDVAPETRSYGGSDQPSPWQFGTFSSKDFEAAARLAERDHLVDMMAPTHDGTGRIIHGAHLDEAANAIEAGRPVDLAASASRLADEGITVPPPQTVPVKQRPSSKPRYRAHSLLEFIADNGGISAKDPQVADAMQSFGGQNHFQPGFGKIVRSEGRSLDTLREMAVEAGYLHDEGRHSGGLSTSTINDLLDAIDSEARGTRVYAAGAEGTKTKAELAVAKEANQAAAEKEAHEQAQHFDARMGELAITDVKKGMRARALEIMAKEGENDPLLAFERALIEHEDKQDAIRSARQQSEELHIPGWDVADEPNAAPRLGEQAADGSEKPAGRGSSGGQPRPDSGGAGPAGEKSAELSIGDPALKADADRALEAHGGDVEITLPDENGNLRKVSARAAMREIDDEAKAAAEFQNCVGTNG